MTTFDVISELKSILNKTRKNLISSGYSSNMSLFLSMLFMAIALYILALLFILFCNGIVVILNLLSIL